MANLVPIKTVNVNAYGTRVALTIVVPKFWCVYHGIDRKDMAVEYKRYDDNKFIIHFVSQSDFQFMYKLRVYSGPKGKRVYGVTLPKALVNLYGLKKGDKIILYGTYGSPDLIVGKYNQEESHVNS